MGAMSGTLATIFGLEPGKKWITRDGREGDLPDRLGRADGERAEEVLGAAHQSSIASVMRRAMTLRQSVSSAPSKIDSTRASTK